MQVACSRVLQIDRVQNRGLYTKFLIRRGEVLNQAGRAAGPDTFLFHGSNPGDCRLRKHSNTALLSFCDRIRRLHTVIHQCIAGLVHRIDVSCPVAADQWSSPAAASAACCTEVQNAGLCCQAPLTTGWKFRWERCAAGVLAKITQEGFDARVSNTGGSLGAGTYFARHLSYSLAYIDRVHSLCVSA